jgi:hypothetical protein
MFTGMQKILLRGAGRFGFRGREMRFDIGELLFNVAFVSD